ncbi:CDGSH iron-sulfur domain-containing protein 1-like isoform X2 [Asterias amurensis]|uniref:CDGSH iron-sulfur domain-containing protein 1-like isoform X2 n=1 Tax=Asterias amurensis TaxID=7602 RepID=UPI003AB2F434
MTIGCKDWLYILPAAGAVGVVAYFVVSKIKSQCESCGDTIVNRSVMKDQEKVVHSYDMEDLADSVAFCRCWRSKKFPFCDGTHNSHNKVTGDNVGPLCLSKKSKGSS